MASLRKIFYLAANLVSEVLFEPCLHSCEITTGATVTISLENGD